MKLSVIGAGRLGGEIGYLAARKGFVAELVYVDMVATMAEGQAEDVAQAVAYECNVKTKSGWDNVAGSDVCVIVAGKPRTPEIKSRLELAEINKKTVSEVVSEAVKRAPSTVLVVVTNPMDAMNYVAYKAAGLPRAKVIGFGGQLDSARFRRVLALKTGVPVTDVQADVLGEHGDTQVPVFSRVKIAGKERRFSDDEKKDIREKLKGIALEVISKKGATIFAPASSVADLVGAIAKDSRRVLPVSAIVEGEYGASGISIGVPAVIGKNGIEKIEQWQLDEEEKNQFQKSADALKEFCEKL